MSFALKAPEDAELRLKNMKDWLLHAKPARFGQTQLLSKNTPMPDNSFKWICCKSNSASITPNMKDVPTPRPHAAVLQTSMEPGQRSCTILVVDPPGAWVRGTRNVETPLLCYRQVSVARWARETRPRGSAIARPQNRDHVQQ